MKKSIPLIYIGITLCFLCIGIGIMIGRFSARAMPKMEEPGYGYTMPPKINSLFDQPEFIDGKLNINVATKENLCLLPGIGDVLADNIIAYRQTEGPFTSVDELRKVEGMGDGKLSAIRDLVTVSE